MTKQKQYFMDSGLFNSYPQTGLTGQLTGNVNQKFKPGTTCKEKMKTTGNWRIDGFSDLARQGFGSNWPYVRMLLRRKESRRIFDGSIASGETRIR